MICSSGTRTHALLVCLAQSPYANALAASTITKTIAKPTCPLLLPQRLQIRERPGVSPFSLRIPPPTHTAWVLLPVQTCCFCLLGHASRIMSGTGNYALAYLGNRADAPHYVVTELCKLVCKVVKLGWFDTDPTGIHVMRDLTEEIQKFLVSPSLGHRVLGVMLLENLVTEMNQPDTEQGLTKHRKVMTSFRDQSLFKIFEVAREMTFKLVREPPTGENPELVRTNGLSSLCSPPSPPALRNFPCGEMR